MTSPRPSTTPTFAARDATVLRASLVAVWLATALASALEAHGQSAALLARGGVTSPTWAAFALWSGVALDVVLGLLLWLRPRRAVFDIALAATALMTVVATVLLPAMWLHPLGPLVKNLPIVAVLFVLRRNAPAP